MFVYSLTELRFRKVGHREEKGQSLPQLITTSNCRMLPQDTTKCLTFETTVRQHFLILKASRKSRDLQTAMTATEGTTTRQTSLGGDTCNQPSASIVKGEAAFPRFA